LHVFDSDNEKAIEDGEAPVTEGEIEAGVKLLQTLDPAGVGARDIRECLLLQLDSFKGDHSIERFIVESHLESLAGNKLPDIAKALNEPLERVKLAADFIKRNLNPKPGLLFDNEAPRYIVPDVIIREIDGDLEVSLNNSAMPRIRFNSKLLKMIEKQELSKEDQDFVSGKRESAKWLLSAVEQRKRTLLSISEAVAKKQKKFFLYGVNHLKPLFMKNLADELGIDVSTVSRAVSGKYVDSPQGIIALREMFTTGYDSGYEGEVSGQSVKEELKRLVASEDRRHPLSDDALAEAFRKKGIDISRRTITKYRAELDIPNTRLRKQF
jgi:RNA polymerase sigma-54 factor